MFKCIRLVAGVCAIGAVLCFTAGNAWAADRTWDGGGTGDDWTTAGNWSGDIVPGSGDAVYISTTASGTPEITSSVSDTGYLRLGNGASDSGNLHIKDSGSLTITDASLGSRGEGTLTIETGASLTIANRMSLGYADNGDGDVVQNGGTVTVGTNIEMANGASGLDGRYEIHGGTLNLNSTASGYLRIGKKGTGTFVQTGGTVNVARTGGWGINIGEDAGSTSLYQMSGGQLNITGNSLLLGHGGSGTFTQTGGDVSVCTDVKLATNGSGSGTYNLEGGALTVGGAILDGAGTWKFNFKGGTLHAAAVDFDLINDDQDNLGFGTGILAPGESVGTTAITGTYTQGDLAKLLIEIKGTGLGGTNYDLVTVTGTADLDGYLDVDLVSFTPELGDYFDVLTAPTITGADQLALIGDSPGSYSWSLSTEGTAGSGQQLRLTVVPEPTTLVLLGIGALGLLLWRLRRRSA